MSKGKVLLAMFALLAVPAVGFGQWNGEISLTSGGLNEITVAPGATFPLMVSVDSNQPVSGVQYALTGEFLGAFDAGVLSSYGALINKGVLPEPNLYAIGDVSSKMSTTPVSLAGLQPELVFRNTGETGGVSLGIFPDSLLNYTMTAPDSLGDFTLSIRDAILTNSNGDIGLSNGLGVATLLVHTPEPSSILLLLAAVPFLRRRRA